MKPSFFVSNAILANVDEAFVDLCRQLLRKDDAFESMLDDDTYHKHGGIASSHRRKFRSKKKRDHSHPRCSIL
jgi:Ras-related protein Rap-1B